MFHIAQDFAIPVRVIGSNRDGWDWALYFFAPR